MMKDLAHIHIIHLNNSIVIWGIQDQLKALGKQDNCLRLPNFNQKDVMDTINFTTQSFEINVLPIIKKK